MQNVFGNNWEFHHVATVVKDMDAAVKYYESLGIFTFQPEFALDATTYEEYEVYGKSVKSSKDKTRMRFASIGPNRIELVSPVQGNPLYVDFLKQKGEGIHHIAFYVDDLEAEIKKLKAKGIPMLTKVKRAPGRGFAYFDIRKQGGVILEIIQRPPKQA